jgi:hypothetical protein
VVEMPSLPCLLLLLCTAISTTSSYDYEEEEEDQFATDDNDDTPLEFSVTIIRDPVNPEFCTQAKLGDEVRIQQKGWRMDTNEMIDQSGPHMPLIIPKLGNGFVLLGMEKGIEGMCLGEIVSVVIPPEMAFYQPGKSFQKMPVPNGVYVKYQIELIHIVQSNTLWNLFTDPILIALFLLFTFVLYWFNPLSPRTKVKGGNRRRVVTGGPSLRQGTSNGRKNSRKKRN